MKNRRIAIFAFLLVAVMIMAVGFANLTDTLVVTGNAAIDADLSEEAFDEKVYFDKALGDVARVTATIGDNEEAGDKDKVTISVKEGALVDAGDEVIVTCSIKNESDLDAYINTTLSNIDNTTNFSVFTNWKDAEQLLEAGEVADVIVTIRCIQTPTADTAVNFTLTFGVSTASSASNS